MKKLFRLVSAALQTARYSQIIALVFASPRAPNALTDATATLGEQLDTLFHGKAGTLSGGYGQVIVNTREMAMLGGSTRRPKCATSQPPYFSSPHRWPPRM
jgi:hypothetical protein